MDAELETLQGSVEALLSGYLSRRQFLKSVAVLTGNIAISASQLSELALLLPPGAPAGTDYAFVPGRTDYENALRQFFKDRLNTEVVDVRGMNTVEKFLDYLEQTDSVVKPVGNLYIVAHGNNAAFIKIFLDDQRDDEGRHLPATYEVVKTAVASKSVNLSKDLNHTKDGTLTSLSVNIRGCRIGDAEPFVDKLKDAFGGDSPVTAPKHYHWVYPDIIRSTIGHFEYLKYGFQITNKTPLKKPELISAFRTKLEQFKFYDQTTVPVERWDEWIPRSVGLGDHEVVKVNLKLGRRIGSLDAIPDAIIFRHEKASYAWKVPRASMPANAARLPALRQSIQDHSQDPSSFWATTHPLPIYKRYRHNSINEFIDGMTWSFSWDAKNSWMVCSGTQHEYIILVPITDPPDLATGKLIYNFSPPKNSNLTPVEPELLTIDKKLFYTA